MRYWHLNTSSPVNKNHMLKYNIGMIGLEAYPHKEVRKNNPWDTIGQWDRFKKNVRDRDIILLYHCGLGYIAYGVYKHYKDSLVVDNTDSNILSPDKDWLGSIQGHIHDDKWNLFTTIIMKNPIYKSSNRYTLTELSRGNELFEYLLTNNKVFDT